MAGTQAAQEAPILGYTIRERIGAGGYGEVWRAEAPGGLEKAIKIVYGYHDEDRAARELKALGRIKQVHHPFLISLERIEIVDGRLVIVTELAERSLKDCFDKHVADGLLGIPREELLVYMRDAADALDYMSERFSLQHLDIKPENLLLMGGRVKVADFGLVKQVQNITSPSMLGGLTPAYAAPELFDDRPTIFSDQYGLAIVYHEMLCGELPFPGRTPAQLATQHLHSRPNLERLPPHDRPVLARALAKLPEERFSSCREFVAALEVAPKAEALRAERRVQPQIVHGATTSPASARDAKLHLSGKMTEPSSDSTRESLQVVPFLGRELPKVDVLPDETRLRPTLWIAVGATAVRTLTHLRHRIEGRFGAMRNLPAWETLVIETDGGSLRDAAANGHTDLGPCLLVPLRKPQHYRDHSDRFSNWLSRRWLYNIPRSQRTEGIRPLGRLCFVDHADEIGRAIDDALSRIVAPDALQKTADATGISAVNRDPAVVIVGSLAGATGGGMALDLMYMVKSKLRAMGANDVGLGCILTHGTERSTDAQDLAVANSTSSLKELFHFTCLDGFPGAGECGTPSYPRDDSRSLGTYVVHLGENQSEQEWDAATERLAEYLYAQSCTSAGTFLDRCRVHDAEAVGSDSFARSIAVFHVGTMRNELPGTAARSIAAAVIKGWLETGRSGGSTDGTAGAMGQAVDVKSLIGALGITSTSLELMIRQAVETQIGLSIPFLAEKTVSEHLGASRELRADRLPALVAGIDAFLGITANEDDEETLDEDPPVARRVKWQVDKLRAEFTTRLSQAVNAVLNHPQGRWGTARRMVEQLIETLRVVDAEIIQSAEQAATAVREAVVGLQSLAGAAESGRRGQRVDARRNSASDALAAYFVARANHLFRAESSRLARLLLSKLSHLSSQLVDLSRELKQIQEAIGAVAFPPKEFRTPQGIANADQLSLALVKELQRGLPELSGCLDDAFQSETLIPLGGLMAVVTAGPELRKTLGQRLLARAEEVIVRSLRAFDVAAALLAPSQNGTDPKQELAKFVAATNTPFATKGSRNRWILVAPPTESSRHFRDLLHAVTEEEVVLAHYDEPSLMLCREIEQVSIQRLIRTLVENRPDYAEAASRLHTRQDVAWRKPALGL